MFAQNTDSTSVSQDSLSSDTVTTTLKKDSIQSADSIAIKKKRDIETTIKYSAKDSMRMDVARQIVYLYGSAKINYGEINLEAEKIEINWKDNTLTAYGGEDTTGKTIGIPIFKQGSEMYTSEVIKYNFKSKKGLISKLITQQGEGYIHGERVKRKEDKLYINHARYTTCNLAHPHFYISANRLKLIPDDKIIAGPFNLVIGDVPTPLGFPLGMFPVPKKNKSGLIFPAYGENSLLGFYLSRGGWYFALGDYFGLKITGDVYTKGTLASYIDAGYKKRYAFGGNVGFNLFHQKNKLNDLDKPLTYYSFIWSHSSMAVGKTSSLTASVNISSSSYYALNSQNPGTRLANDFRSSVYYRKTFANTPFTLNISALQSQNVTTRLMNITLPDIAFTMNRIFPFRSKGSLGKAWYEQISLQYNFETRMSLNNGYQLYNPLNKTFTEGVSGLTLKNVNSFKRIIEGGMYYKYGAGDTLSLVQPGEKYDSIRLNGAQYAARHTIPIQTTFKIFKKFSLNPAFNFTEYWYPRSEKISYSQGLRDSLTTIVEKGFSRAWGWSTAGTSIRTNLYGTVIFKKGKLMGVRHIATPSVSYSYSPDLTLPLYGSYSEVRDKNNNLFYQNGQPYRLPRYGKYSTLYSYPSGTKASILSFSFDNVVEAKVRNAKDTANPTKKIKILDNLSIAGSYNFLAPSFKFSTIGVTARTNFKDGKINVSFNSVFDPYLYVEDTTYRKDKFGNATYKRKDTLARPVFLNGNLSITTSLNPKAKKATKKPVAEEDKDQLDYIKSNPQMYVDFNIPWNAFVSYQLNFKGSNFHYGQKKRTDFHSLTFNGDISITEKLKLTFNTSYDIVNRELPMATIGIMRDLHCWQMNFNISKYASNTGLPIYMYTFNINAKSSLLQDLKINKHSPNVFNSMTY